MRTNMPITMQEYVLREDMQIVSSTNLNGIITRVNPDFVESSGYSEAELMGSPHNILRHPDMPAAAFQDLWDTVKAGKPWSGLVKNRRKNGDYYWVEANVSPLRVNGNITGYISVRRRPERNEIQAVEALYQLMRQGKQVKGFVSRMADQIGALSIRSSLPGGLLIISLLYIAATLQAFLGMQTAVNLLQRYTDHIQVQHGAYNGMLNEGLQMAAAMRYVMLDPADQQARDNIKTSQSRFSEHLETARRLASDEAGKQALNDIARERAQQGDIQNRIQTVLDSGDITTALSLYKTEDNRLWRSYKVHLLAGIKQTADIALTEKEGLNQAVTAAKIRVLVLALLAALVALILGIWMVRKISLPVREAQEHLEAIAEGNYNTRIRPRHQDEIGEMMVALKSMQARLDYDLQETRRIANENLRVKIALDNVSSGVMMADTHRRIIYANKAVRFMFKAAEHDIRKQLPHFNADNLLGANIDLFHKNPSHQANLLATLSNTYRSALNIGVRSMTVVANPVINEKGERLGAVVEWSDRTAEVAVEREVASLVNAAANGNFSHRLNLAGKEGFFLQLAEGINKLVATSERGMTDVALVLKALSQGDLTQRVEGGADGNYEGLFGQLQNDKYL